MMPFGAMRITLSRMLRLKICMADVGRWNMNRSVRCTSTPVIVGPRDTVVVARVPGVSLTTLPLFFTRNSPSVK